MNFLRMFSGSWISEMDYHIPVLLDECIRGLNIDPDGVYVDATFGGGGHSAGILERLENGRLFAFDQDEDAEENSRKINDTRFRFISGNFRHLVRYLKLFEVKKIDGLIADLGISSHQIDQPERGFSTRFEGNLDMRMDITLDLTAGMIINTYSEENLHRIFSTYGEVKNSRKLARSIVRERINRKFTTTMELTGILEKLSPANKKSKYFAQVFQAIRIEVNDEINSLKSLLLQASTLLKTGGRIVILSYHSLEDRVVKNYFTKGSFEGVEQKDIYGNSEKPFRAVNKKPMKATPDEVETNPRARSVRLRIAEKK